MEFYASCPLGFERLLADELRRLKLPQVRPLTGQVAFGGELSDAYRACLWSRLASRVVLVLARGEARDADALYEEAQAIAWEEHLMPGMSFLVDAHGTNEKLRNTRFVAQRTKDALVDRMRARRGMRPMVNPSSPDLICVVRISRERASFGIDLSGAPLFRRGYELRQKASESLTPLRADYAAALLALGGWGEGEAQALAVPFSGTGTLLLEAASLALHRAPGLLRARWGFERWAGHETRSWDKLKQEAVELSRQHVEALPQIVFSDLRPGAETHARQMLRAAGINASFRFSPLAELGAALDGPALLACDLSWLRDDDIALQAAALSGLLCAARSLAAGSSASILAAQMPVDETLGLSPEKNIEVRLGREAGNLRAYSLTEPQAPSSVALPDGERIETLVSTSDQFAARLRKNMKLRQKWARREGVSCYRVYDADLPDYAVSIDLFEGAETPGQWLQVYEYAPPRSVDPLLARRRLLDVLAIAPPLLKVEAHNVFVRVRTRSKGGEQYANEARSPKAASSREHKLALPPGAKLIDEGGLSFEVNFHTRLDCGIFLDHRDTRAMLREMAKQTRGSKRFLNLFAYTGTATCYAADGGAKHTTTVDLSRPSLDWAHRNMERNGFSGPEHEFIQADVMSWIREQRHSKNRWDLIFCDVPTFSNSRRMGHKTFDVQRDHVELLIGVSRLLTRAGTAVFSCNLRSFSPNVEALAKAGVVLEDISETTIPEDFQRNKRIHKCYLLRRG